MLLLYWYGYWISEEYWTHSSAQWVSRLLLGPSTRSTTAWIAFDSMDGGCTSVGPFGLSLMDVRSPHAALAVSAAKTLRIWYLMIVLRFPSGSRPHGQGEADAARGGQLPVFDALPVAGVERRFRVDGGLLRPEQQIAAHQRDGRLREADEPRHRRRHVVGQAQFAELQIARVHDTHLVCVEGVVPVVLGQHVRRVGLAALVDGVRHHEAVVPVVLASLQSGVQDA